MSTLTKLSRREFLSKTMSFAASAGLITSPFLSSCSKKRKRPNIVLILADDLGYSDIGCYGAEIQTSNIDKIAKNGVRFTHFYNTARCCPTRASLITGLYPHQTGQGWMGYDFNLPAYRGEIQNNCVTIAEVLKQAGYRTLFSGKWDVGAKNPGNRGFEKYYCWLDGATNFFNPTFEPDRLISNCKDYYGIKPGGIINRKISYYQPAKDWTPGDPVFYLTDAISDHAVGLLEDYGRNDDPFFLYLSYTAPHEPLHAFKKDIDKYKGVYDKSPREVAIARHKRQIELGIVDPDQPYSPPSEVDMDYTIRPEVSDEFGSRPARNHAEMMEVYAAMTDNMDQGIGRVLDKIKEIGAEENTMVIFLSDNGANWRTRSQGIPWATVNNTPFNKWKGWTYEGGITTPLVVQWKAEIKNKGQIVHDKGHVIDIMATICDITGASYHDVYNGNPIVPLEGKSLMPALKNGSREGHEALYFEHGGDRAIIKDDYKLLSHQGEPWKLFDLKKDRIESNNIIGQKTEIAKEMEKLYNNWAKKCNVLPPNEFIPYYEKRTQFRATRYYWLNIWRQTHKE